MTTYSIIIKDAKLGDLTIFKSNNEELAYIYLDYFFCTRTHNLLLNIE